jgi:hypothetical protein
MSVKNMCSGLRLGFRRGGATAGHRVGKLEKMTGARSEKRLSKNFVEREACERCEVSLHIFAYMCHAWSCVCVCYVYHAPLLCEPSDLWSDGYCELSFSLMYGSVCWRMLERWILDPIQLDQSNGPCAFIRSVSFGPGSVWPVDFISWHFSCYFNSTPCYLHTFMLKNLVKNSI